MSPIFETSFKILFYACYVCFSRCNIYVNGLLLMILGGKVTTVSSSSLSGWGVDFKMSWSCTEMKFSGIKGWGYSSISYLFVLIIWFLCTPALILYMSLKAVQAFWYSISYVWEFVKRLRTRSRICSSMKGKPQSCISRVNVFIFTVPFFSLSISCRVVSSIWSLSRLVILATFYC